MRVKDFQENFCWVLKLVRHHVGQLTIKIWRSVGNDFQSVYSLRHTLRVCHHYMLHFGNSVHDFQSFNCTLTLHWCKLLIYENNTVDWFNCQFASNYCPVNFSSSSCCFFFDIIPRIKYFLKLFLSIFNHLNEI